MSYSASILPTDTKMNPRDPEAAYYYNADQVHEIVRSEKGTYRIFSTFGGGSEIGESFEVHHDQTGRRMGRYTVVGLAWTSKEGKRYTDGDVPNREITFMVYK